MAMSRQAKITWWIAIPGAVLATLTLLATLTRPVASSVAEEAVRPVSARVDALDARLRAQELQGAAIKGTVESIKDDTNCILNMHMSPPQPCNR